MRTVESGEMNKRRVINEPRPLRGRHRTTTLMFPSPASAMFDPTGEEGDGRL